MGVGAKPLVWITLICLLIGCTPEKKDVLDQKGEFCASIHRIDSSDLSKSLAPLAELLRDSTGVFVLEDGGGSMIARAWLSEYAEKSIDIQYFIFSPDKSG